MAKSTEAIEKEIKQLNAALTRKENPQESLTANGIDEDEAEILAIKFKRAKLERELAASGNLAKADSVNNKVIITEEILENIFNKIKVELEKLFRLTLRHAPYGKDLSCFCEYVFAYQHRIDKIRYATNQHVDLTRRAEQLFFPKQNTSAKFKIDPKEVEREIQQANNNRIMRAIFSFLDDFNKKFLTPFVALLPNFINGEYSLYMKDIYIDFRDDNSYLLYMNYYQCFDAIFEIFLFVKDVFKMSYEDDAFENYIDDDGLALHVKPVGEGINRAINDLSLTSNIPDYVQKIYFEKQLTWLKNKRQSLSQVELKSQFGKLLSDQIEELENAEKSESFLNFCSYQRSCSSVVGKYFYDTLLPVFLQYITKMRTFRVVGEEAEKVLNLVNESTIWFLELLYDLEKSPVDFNQKEQFIDEAFAEQITDSEDLINSAKMALMAFNDSSLDRKRCYKKVKTYFGGLVQLSKAFSERSNDNIVSLQEIDTFFLREQTQEINYLSGNIKTTVDRSLTVIDDICVDFRMTSCFLDMLVDCYSQIEMMLDDKDQYEAEGMTAFFDECEKKKVELYQQQQVLQTHVNDLVRQLQDQKQKDMASLKSAKLGRLRLILNDTEFLKKRIENIDLVLPKLQSLVLEKKQETIRPVL